MMFLNLAGGHRINIFFFDYGEHKSENQNNKLQSESNQV